MKDSLIKLSEDYNLIERSIENAKQYIKDWKLEREEEFIEFFSDYNLEDALPDDFSAVEFVALKIRHEVRFSPDNLEALQVVILLMTLDPEDNHIRNIFYYFCYYDMNGEFMEDFIDF